MFRGFVIFIILFTYRTVRSTLDHGTSHGFYSRRLCRGHYAVCDIRRLGRTYHRYISNDGRVERFPSHPSSTLVSILRNTLINLFRKPWIYDLLFFDFFFVINGSNFSGKTPDSRKIDQIVSWRVRIRYFISFTTADLLIKGKFILLLKVEFRVNSRYYNFNDDVEK